MTVASRALLPLLDHEVGAGRVCGLNLFWARFLIPGRTNVMASAAGKVKSKPSEWVAPVPHSDAGVRGRGHAPPGACGKAQREGDAADVDTSDDHARVAPVAR